METCLGNRADARLLLRRMAKNDRHGWSFSKHPQWIPGRDERQHWNDILTWQRYSIPPMHQGMAPSKTLFFRRTTRVQMAFPLTLFRMERLFSRWVPVLSLIGSTQETSEEPPWSTKKQEEFVETVTAWFKEKICKGLLDSLQQTLQISSSKHWNANKEIIPRATDNKYQAWMPWFEDTILNQSQFNTYVLVRPNGKPYYFKKKFDGESRHWLFDDTSATAPRPQASDGWDHHQHD